MTPPVPAVDAVLTPAGSSPGSGTASPGLGPAGVAGKERRRKNKRIVDLNGEGTGADDASLKKHTGTRSEGGKTKTQAKDRSPSKAPEIEVQLSTPASETQAEQIPSPTRSVQRVRHVRRQTEGYPSPTEESHTPVFLSPSNRKATFSSKPPVRRSRASASVYEPTTVNAETSTDSQTRDAEAYRRRIEALKSDMGEGWLKVFNQSQMGSPGVAMG